MDAERPVKKVLDADGVEIRVGDTVYEIECGTEFEVCEAKLPRVTVEHWRAGIAAHSSIAPSLLTHRAPVLAADGKPLEAGQTMWTVDAGIEFEVHSIEGDTVWGSLDGDRTDDGLDPKSLTHERPDSWERLEEDADKNPFDYCEDVGHRLDTCENSEAYKARDLVRRAKKLAGVER